MAADWVAYWDASAVIAALFDELRSQEALAHARHLGIHLLSGLGWAEVQATMARVERERRLASVLIAAADEALRLGPWRAVHPDPSWASVRMLSRRHGSGAPISGTLPAACDFAKICPNWCW